MKITILAVLFALVASSAFADCEAERYEYGKAKYEYNRVIKSLWPKIHARKQLNKKELKELDRVSKLVYDAKFNYDVCSENGY